MKKLILGLSFLAIAATTTFVACKKDEVKAPTPTQQATPAKNLARGSGYSYVKYGELHEYKNDFFCTYAQKVCHLVVVGRKKSLDANTTVFYPADGETSFEIVKNTTNGEVSEFYTELTETIDANGNAYYTGIKANP